jgi:hypothetical protein
MRFSHVFCVSILLLVATGISDVVQAQSDEPFGAVYRVPVMITYKPSAFPLSAAVVNAVLTNESFLHRLTPVVEAVPPRFQVMFDRLGDEQSPGRLVGSLTIYGANPENADEWKEPQLLWQAVVQELDEVLSEMAKQLEQQHEAQWDLQRHLLQQKRDDVKNQLDKWIQAAASVRTIDSAERLEQLSSKQHEISFQLAGIEARRQALQDRIEELTDTSPASELDRQIIEQLEHIVAFHEQQFARLREHRNARAVTEFQVNEAEAELAKARIDVLRAKKEAATKASPELTALSEELSQATITAAEQRAILQAIESRMEELKQAAAEHARQVQRAQEAERRAAILREQLATIEKRLSAMELERLEQMAARGGTVTIVPWSVPPAED